MSTKNTLTQVEAAAAVGLVNLKRMALNIFRPQAHQEPIYEDPQPKFFLVSGGNRAGKTICLAGLLSAFALDMPIIFEDGTQHEIRRPDQKGRPVVIWIVCVDQKHIGNVIYPGLFKAGFFKRFNIVQDPITKQYRTHNHDTDKHLKPLPHPPFIPKQFAPKQNFAWEEQKKGIFTKVDIIKPGRPDADPDILATIHAFTSKGDAPQGSAVDFILIEEQLSQEGYIAEMKARLGDTRGRLCWSSWAADEGEESDLAAFEAMIDEGVRKGSPLYRKVVLTLSGNKTFTKEMIEEHLDGFSEEERLQRDLGIRPSEKLRMYPRYTRNLCDALGYDDEIARILRRTDGIPPSDWLKTLVLDPGTSHPCVTLFAVPPPELGDYRIAWQVIYPGRADPVELAKIVKPHLKGHTIYNFIIDYRAGRAQTVGNTVTARESYRLAFEAENLGCVLSGSQFVYGSDDVGGRQLVVQSWLHENQFGIPKLRIVNHRCEPLVKQLGTIKKATVNKDVRDDRVLPGMAKDASDTLEYWAASGPRWVNVKPRTEDLPDAYKKYLKRFGSKNEAVRFGTQY